MGQKSGLREFIKYAVFNVLGMIGLSCYILADTFFVSKGMGVNGLTALNLAIPVYSFINGTGLMLGMGGAIRYAIYKGQGRTGDADATYTSTLWLSVLFASVFVAAGVAGPRTLARLLGADEAVFDMTAGYLKVILLFSPAFILNTVQNAYVRNDGSPQLAMAAMVIGSLSNIVLDYLFIFPFGMGISGAALATGFAPVIGLATLSLHFARKKNGFHPVRAALRLKLSGNIMALGFSSLVTELSSGIVMIVFNMIILKLEGNVGVAAYGVVANISIVAVSIFNGIAQGSQPLISTAYGTRDSRGCRQVLGYAMAAMAALAFLIYGVLFVGAEPVAGVFNSGHNPQMQAIAVTGLKYYFTALVFAGFNIVLATYFAATEQIVFAQAVSLMRGLAVIIPMAFLLSALWGITGVWLSFPAAELVVALFGAAAYRLGDRKTKNTEVRDV